MITDRIGLHSVLLPLFIATHLAFRFVVKISQKPIIIFFFATALITCTSSVADRLTEYLIKQCINHCFLSVEEFSPIALIETTETSKQTEYLKLNRTLLKFSTGGRQTS